MTSAGAARPAWRQRQDEFSIAETPGSQAERMSASCHPGQLRWESHFPGMDSIWYLMLGTDQLARVARRVDAGWSSEVARHRRDWRRRPVVMAPSRRTALRWAETWTRANFDRILDELPPLWRTQCGVLTMASLECRVEAARPSSRLAR